MGDGLLLKTTPDPNVGLSESFVGVLDLDSSKSIEEEDKAEEGVLLMQLLAGLTGDRGEASSRVRRTAGVRGFGALPNTNIEWESLSSSSFPPKKKSSLVLGFATPEVPTMPRAEAFSG